VVIAAQLQGACRNARFLGTRRARSVAPYEPQMFATGADRQVETIAVFVMCLFGESGNDEAQIRKENQNGS